MDPEVINDYLKTAGTMVIEYAPKVAIAIIILLIGIRVINRIVRLVTNTMKKQGIGENILPFIGSIAGVGLKIMLVFLVAGILGFDVTSIVAVLAAAGFAVGLALQGSLSNFAAGILILIFRPYKVNDWVQVEDFFGRVQEIQIFNTILVTPGEKTLIVPNGQIIDNVVTNYSERGQVRLELELLMAYEESFPKIKEILLNALKDSSYVLDTPAAQVGIEKYDTHNIIVAVKPFVNPDEYWDATFSINELLKTALSKHGIKMAYSEGVELGSIGE